MVGQEKQGPTGPAQASTLRNNWNVGLPSMRIHFQQLIDFVE